MDTPPALCIFCGRDRIVTDDTCPSCGRGWVDRLVTGAPGPAPTAAGASEPETAPAAEADAGAKAGAVEPETPPVTDDGADPPTFEQNLHPPLVVPAAPALAAKRAMAEEPVATAPADKAPDEKAPDEKVPPGEEPADKEPAAEESADKGSVQGAAAKDDSAADASDDPAGPPPEASKAKRRDRTNQLVIGAIVVAVVVGWFGVLAWITAQDDDVPSVLPTTTTADEPGQASTTAPPVTTTVAPSTTTTSTTTTTTIPPIEPEGEPIPTTDLALGAFALGPIDFGATDGLGRLVASLGQPDLLEDAGTELGLCEGDTGFSAGWGPLTGIFEGTVDEAALVGYRLGQDGGHPAAGLATLSGLAVGDTVADLEAVYEGFTVVYEDIDGVDTFIVVRTSDDVTLLWGPLSSAEDTGVVEGIHSPLPCDGGPIPTS